MAGALQVDADADLAAEFASIKKPWRIPDELIAKPLEVIEEKAIGVKLGLLGGAAKYFTKKMSLRRAAWAWLKPEGGRTTTHDHLPDLQRKVGLAHVEHRTFCMEMIEECRAMAGPRPALSRYLEMRVAEAEYKLAPFASDLAFAGGFERLQGTLIIATAARNPTIARMVATNALAQVCAVLKRALSANHGSCSFDANLMLPVASPPAYGHAAESARELWGSAASNVEQYFAVLAEWPESPPKYDGFWIPDIRRRNTSLPGAPRAFYFKTPQAIFVDHLPELPLDDELLRGRWRDYFLSGEGFGGDTFISLPVVDEGNPVAVVNVNVRDQVPWFRALSRSWLNRAWVLSAPWIATAWHAAMLAWALENEHTKPAFMPRKVPTFLSLGAAPGVESSPKLLEVKR